MRVEVDIKIATEVREYEKEYLDSLNEEDRKKALEDHTGRIYDALLDELDLEDEDIVEFEVRYID